MTSEVPDPRHGVLLRRWGRVVARHPWPLLVGWVVLIALGFALAMGAFGNQSLFDRLQSGGMVTPGEAQDGYDALDDAGQSGDTTYTLLLSGVDLADPATARYAAAAVKSIMAIPHVKSAVNPYVVPGGPTGPAAAPLLAGGTPDAHGFATSVTFDQQLETTALDRATAKVDRRFDDLAEQTGAESERRGGVTQLVDAIIGQVQSDLRVGEGIALPFSFLVMIVVFGGFLAAGLPLMGAIASISGALLSLLGFSHLMDLDATVVNVVTVLGLGLCIDYGLLVVSRFREELRGQLRGAPVGELTSDMVATAAEHTVDRAGRTVIFSAITVAISLTGLFAFTSDIIRALGAAGVSIVLLALAVALTLIPPACVLVAKRLVRRGTEAAPDHGIFSRLATFVHRVPWLVIVAVLVPLVVLALPSLDMRVTNSSTDLLPVDNDQRLFFEALREDYPALNGPEVIVVAEAAGPAVKAWARTAADLPDVTDPPVVQKVSAHLYTVGLFTGDGGLGEASRRLTTRLRTDRPPFSAYITGQASSLQDFTDAAADRAPWAAAMVGLATLVLLFLMTGSVIIPVKALIMNVFSLSASLGLMVWVFQEGHLSGLLGFDSVGAIESVVPILVIAFGFGLSMDYEVFLLSRIVELRERGHDTTSAVTLGLQRSGRIITSAALLMVIVFAGFAAGYLLVMKEVGFAMVAAVALDATLVRMLLVPATMSVLGNWNWWAPAPLRALHSRWGVTE